MFVGRFKVWCQKLCPIVLSAYMSDEVLPNFKDNIGSTRSMCMLAERVTWKEACVGCIVSDRACQMIAEATDQWIGNPPVLG